MLSKFVFVTMTSFVSSQEAEAVDKCSCLFDTTNGLPPNKFFIDKGYDGQYGAYCSKWDESQTYCRFGGAYYGEDWCTSPWCYVSAECETGLGTLFFADTDYETLQWSLLACADADKATALYASALIAIFAATAAYI